MSLRSLFSRVSVGLLVGLACISGACRSEPDASQPDDPSAATPVNAAVNKAAQSDSAAAAFVAAFYAAYTPRAIASGLAAMDSLVAEQPALFAPELLAAIQRDVGERAEVVGEIAGLDFEPFLNSQDPCERYEVGEVARGESSGSAQVSVYAVCDGVRGATPAVVVELAPTAAGSWTFLNLHYPGHPPDELLAILRRLHPEVSSG